MKIWISEEGFLALGRKGGDKPQQCPTSQFYDDEDNHYVQDFCGDWCPLFGEPAEVAGGLTMSLSLCHGKEIRCLKEDFVDERMREEEKCLAS